MGRKRNRKKHLKRLEQESRQIADSKGLNYDRLEASIRTISLNSLDFVCLLDREIESCVQNLGPNPQDLHVAHVENLNEIKEFVKQVNCYMDQGFCIQIEDKDRNKTIDLTLEYLEITAALVEQEDSGALNFSSIIHSPMVQLIGLALNDAGGWGYLDTISELFPLYVRESLSIAWKRIRAFG